MINHIASCAPAFFDGFCNYHNSQNAHPEGNDIGKPALSLLLACFGEGKLRKIILNPLQMPVIRRKIG